eukprot:SM000051S17533  [mRNA]  locus=s51:133388:134538:+ [translate_table: standard]
MSSAESGPGSDARRRCAPSGLDAYAVLGVPPSASPEEVKRAYRKLALQWSQQQSPLFLPRLTPPLREDVPLPCGPCWAWPRCKLGGTLLPPVSYSYSHVLGLLAWSRDHSHRDVKPDGELDFRQVTEAYSHIQRAKARPTGTYARQRRPRADGVQPGNYMRRSASSTLAIRVWGLGLFLGGTLFGGALLLGRTEMYNHNMYRRGQDHDMPPTRVIEPSSDDIKRERIARILTERSRQKTPDCS